MQNLASAARKAISALLAFAAFGAVALYTPSKAAAETLQIAAVTFVLRTPNASTDLVGEENNGVLTAGKGKFFAPVVFPTNGQRVCRFSMVVRDNDSDFAVFARLKKKPVAVGTNPFLPPVQMAQINTSRGGAAAGVVRKGTIAITEPIIDTAKAFYYAELVLEGSTLEVLGVQIEVKPTCP